jgi:amino acid permease
MMHSKWKCGIRRVWQAHIVFFLNLILNWGEKGITQIKCNQSEAWIKKRAFTTLSCILFSWNTSSNLYFVNVELEMRNNA